MFFNIKPIIYGCDSFHSLFLCKNISFLRIFFVYLYKSVEMTKKKISIEVPNEPREVTEIRNKILNEFKDLQFEEGPHKYFIGKTELPSVSQVTHQFLQPFDSDGVAERYAEKHGMTKEYWLEQWKFNNLKATTTGTLVHEHGESLGWLKNGHPEFITESCKPKYIEDKGWLIPTRPKEEAINKFYDELNENLHFVLAETKVYTGKNKELTNLKQDYAGTFDLLMYYKDPNNSEKDGLVILDYKTNKDLYSDFNRNNGVMMFAPFGDMYSESFGAYTLQLSAYQLPLEDIGLKVIARRIIWLKEDGTYELIPVKDVTKTLREVL